MVNEVIKLNNLELYEIYKLQSHNSELNCYSYYNDHYDHDDCETDYDEDGNYIDYHQVP